ncbi:Anion exchange protein 2 [Frankliniella fusca]|uniref:Anion exchange protein 2 n=1 Tax=Frankliniella fusca TaxID=407009 RepID=A0AAE1GRY5_9NEOP|nr:Anion exchange protein 2 [Frankliniella fusca]
MAAQAATALPQRCRCAALRAVDQPFQGTWLQSIAPFLTRGAAKGKELAMIVLDAITRLEQCGFHVDIISSDGASWNRTMWLEMGMIRTENEKELDDNEDDILSALDAEEEWETSINLDFPCNTTNPEIEVQVEEVVSVDNGTQNKTKKKRKTSRPALPPNCLNEGWQDLHQALRCLGVTLKIP